jgi:hypothetical protein
VLNAAFFSAHGSAWLAKKSRTASGRNTGRTAALPGQAENATAIAVAAASIPTRGGKIDGPPRGCACRENLLCVHEVGNAESLPRYAEANTACCEGATSISMLYGAPGWRCWTVIFPIFESRRGAGLIKRRGFARGFLPITLSPVRDVARLCRFPPQTHLHRAGHTDPMPLAGDARALIATEIERISRAPALTAGLPTA